MPAYWIAHVTVNDPEKYKDYLALAPSIFAAHGGRYLARGGDYAVMEGPVLHRHVIIEFPSLQAARACYDSPEYTAARAARAGASIAHITLLESL